jgi:hypothetical protein
MVNGILTAYRNPWHIGRYNANGPITNVNLREDDFSIFCEEQLPFEARIPLQISGNYLPVKMECHKAQLIQRKSLAVNNFIFSLQGIG